MKRRCRRYPFKRRYARFDAVEHALNMGRAGERYLRVFYCSGCSGWHIGHDWSRIRHEELIAERRETPRHQ